MSGCDISSGHWIYVANTSIYEMCTSIVVYWYWYWYWYWTTSSTKLWADIRFIVVMSPIRPSHVLTPFFASLLFRLPLHAMDWLAVFSWFTMLVSYFSCFQVSLWADSDWSESRNIRHGCSQGQDLSKTFPPVQCPVSPWQMADIDESDVLPAWYLGRLNDPNAYLTTTASVYENFPWLHLEGPRVISPSEAKPTAMHGHTSRIFRGALADRQVMTILSDCWFNGKPNPAGLHGSMAHISSPHVIHTYALPIPLLPSRHNVFTRLRTQIL